MTPPTSPWTKLAFGGRHVPVDALEPQESLDPELASSWAQACAEAHAAAAAQAEFAVRLLRLGAPAALLRGVARAMLDEAALSTACLELACQHGAAPTLPPPAPKCDSTAEVDRTRLVLSTLRRGCITATVEASCAREALEHCQDEAARHVLLQLEQAHARAAQLAWRFLAWALRGASRELTDQVRVAVLTALSTEIKVAPLGTRDRQLLRHGILGAQQRAVIEQRVLRDIVLPCMENTLARANDVRSGHAA